MATRMVIRGHVKWQDSEARAQQKLHAKHLAAVPRDRDKRPMCACSTGVVCERHKQVKKPPAFRAGVPYTDTQDQVVYRVVAHLNPTEGWATEEFFQKRWLIDHKALMQLARHGLIDAAMTEGSQVRMFRARDEAAVLRSDPVLRAALKRKQAAQGSFNDVRAEEASERVGRPRPRRENGRWIIR